LGLGLVLVIWTIDFSARAKTLSNEIAVDENGPLLLDLLMMNPAQQPFVVAVAFVLVVQIPKLIS